MSALIMAAFAAVVFGLGAGAMYFVMAGKQGSKPGAKGYPMPEVTGFGGPAPAPPTPASPFAAPAPSESGLSCLLCSSSVKGHPYRCGVCSYRSEWEGQGGKRGPIRAVQAVRKALEQVKGVTPGGGGLEGVPLGFFAQGGGGASPEQAKVSVEAAHRIITEATEIPGPIRERILARTDPLKLKRELDNAIIELRTAVLLG